MIDAESRGRLRVWKTEALHRWTELEEKLTTDNVHAVARDFALRNTGRGQSRALAQLRRIVDPLCYFEVARLGSRAKALWAALVPRGPVILHSDDPSEQQTGVAVYFVMAGRIEGRASSFDIGLWSVEVSDHALGRLFQRGGPGVALDEVLIEAHRHVVRHRLHSEGNDGEEIFMPAGPGAFAGERVVGISETKGVPVGYVRCRTWLHADQLGEDQDRLLEHRAEK